MKIVDKFPLEKMYTILYFADRTKNLNTEVLAFLNSAGWTDGACTLLTFPANWFALSTLVISSIPLFGPQNKN